MLYRIRNACFIFLMLLCCYLLQYSVIARISFLKCAPNLMLILTFFFAYTRGKNSGMLVGFFAGLMMDIYFCDVIGYNMLVLLIIGLICGMLGKNFYSDNVFTPMLILMLSAFVYDLCYYFFWFMLQSTFAFGYILIHTIIPELLLTFFAGIIMLKPLTFLIGKMYRYCDAEVQK